MKQTIQCNRRAGYYIIDIIYISFFEGLEVHSFLCSSAQFCVQFVKEPPGIIWNIYETDKRLSEENQYLILLYRMGI